MRKKMREYLAAIYSPEIEPKLKQLLGRKLISEKDAETIRKSDDDSAQKSRHPPDAVDVLERSRGRTGIHARPHRRARRRVQGMRRGHQDGEDPRLPGRHQHDRLQGNRRAGNRGHVQVPQLAGRGRPHDFARLRLRRGQEGHGQAPRQGPEGFLPDARHDAAEVREDSGLGQGVHHFRHAGLSGIPRRQTRTDLHRLGDSHLQHQGLERRRAT